MQGEAAVDRPACRPPVIFCRPICCLDEVSIMLERIFNILFMGIGLTLLSLAALHLPFKTADAI